MINLLQEPIFLLLEHDKLYVRKKAILCSIKIVKERPETIPLIIDRILPMIDSRNKGILLPAICLAIEICRINPNCSQAFSKWTSRLCVILKHLLSVISTTTQMINVNNPHLQIRTLRMMGIIGQKNSLARPKFIDCMKRVLKCTDSGNLAGQSVLYELIIVCFERHILDDELRRNIIEVLMLFLRSTDINVVYVALAMALRISKSDQTSLNIISDNIDMFLSLLLSNTSILKLNASKVIRYALPYLKNYTNAAIMVISSLRPDIEQKCVLEEADTFISAVVDLCAFEDQQFFCKLLKILLSN
ncbi:MAG: AP-1 complex subunit gamma-1, partial [Marteilia pararefringens]